MVFQLHETMYGRKFFDHDFPELIRSLKAIHSDNEQILEIKEAELQLKRKELILKERELELKEKELGL